MDNLFENIQKYSSLINFAILLSLFGYLIRIFKNIINKKDATIHLLEKRLEFEKNFSVDNVVEKFKSLKEYYKEYYEIHVTEWHKNSIKYLEEEKDKAIKEKEIEFEKLLKDEIKKRTALKDKYERIIKSSKKFNEDILSLDVCGTYSISGRNPDSNHESYFGILNIAKKKNTFNLKWKIVSSKPTQEFKGRGILINNVLSAIFFETEGLEKGWRGIVSYEIIGSEILRGKWAGFDKDKIGFEECRKKAEDE